MDVVIMPWPLPVPRDVLTTAVPHFCLNRALSHALVCGARQSCYKTSGPRRSSETLSPI